jgi:hypothetical protein
MSAWLPGGAGLYDNTVAGLDRYVSMAARWS